MNTSPHDILSLKVVILGNTGCGKTAMVVRWISNRFVGEGKPTIGSNLQRKRVVLSDNEVVDVCIWDTAGQEQFQALMPLYARSAAAAIVTASVDDMTSFEAIPRWIDVARGEGLSSPPVILAVNKIDLVESPVMTDEDIHAKYDDSFEGVFFVSALTGENIDSLFTSAAVEANKFVGKEGSVSSGLPSEQYPKKRGCC
jgi:small GTP-binding protein